MATVCSQQVSTLRESAAGRGFCFEDSVLRIFQYRLASCSVCKLSQVCKIYILELGWIVDI